MVQFIYIPNLGKIYTLPFAEYTFCTHYGLIVSPPVPTQILMLNP